MNTDKIVDNNSIDNIADGINSMHDLVGGIDIMHEINRVSQLHMHQHQPAPAVDHVSQVRCRWHPRRVGRHE